MSYIHVHVSEVPDSPVVECTTASVLEVVRAVMADRADQPPATSEEREALRRASGAPDDAGANLIELQRGVSLRYRLDLPVGPALTATELDALPDGSFLAVQGNMHATPEHLWRWDPAFGAGPRAWHCVCVYKMAGYLWWCDPLAPWGAYAGERVTPALVVAYSAALPGAQVMRGQLSLEDKMLTAAPDGSTTPWDQVVDLTPGTVIVATDGTRVPLVNGGTGVWSPFAVTAYQRAVRFSTAGVSQIGTVPLSACSNMRPRVGPVDTSAAYNNGIDAAAKAVAAVPRK